MSPVDNSNTAPTVVLTADPRPFERELSGALDKYRQWAKGVESYSKMAGDKIRAQSVFKGMGEELKKVQSRFDGITQAALGFTVAGKVAEVAEKAATALRDWVTSAKEYAKALEKASELSQKELALIQKRIASAKELAEAQGAGGGVSRLNAAQAELDGLNQKAAEWSKKLAEAEQKSEDISSVWRRDAGNFRTWLGGGLEEARKDAAEKLKMAKDALAAIKGRTEEVEQQLKRLRNPLEDPEKIANVNKMVAEFDRARQMIGLSEEHAKKLSLELDGFAPEQIERVMDSFRYLNEVKTEQKIRDITKELKKQADTFGMSANEVKLYDLAQEGFTEAQLERIRQEMQASEALIAQKEREAEFAKQVDEYMKEQLKIGETGMVGAQAGGTSGAVNAIAAARADTARFANATPEQKAEMTRQQQLRAQLEAAAELRKVHAGIASMVGLLEGLRAV